MDAPQVFDNPLELHRSGLEALPIILQSHCHSPHSSAPPIVIRLCRHWFLTTIPSMSSNSGHPCCRNVRTPRGSLWHRACTVELRAAPIEMGAALNASTGYRNRPDSLITARSGRGTSCTCDRNRRGTERSCRCRGTYGRRPTGSSALRSSAACWLEPCLRRG